MVQEAFVSFETAKLLKGKGFDEKCLMAYIDGELFNYYDSDFPSEYELKNDGSEVIDAPTQQMAMRWLREGKGLVILIDYNRLLYGPIPYYFHIYTTSGDNGGRESNLAPIDPYYHYKYKTYEEACEASIKYCLENLI